MQNRMIIGYKDLFHFLTIRYRLGLGTHGYESSTISIKVRES